MNVIHHREVTVEPLSAEDTIRTQLAVLYREVSLI